jgi:hypothetical protein
MKKIAGLFLLLPLFAWAQTSFDGTWKVKLSSPQFAQKPQTFALRNGEYTCSTCIPKIAVKADGADHPVRGGKGFDTIAVKRVDDKTVQTTEKKHGKVVSEGTQMVAEGGKTLIAQFKQYPAHGKPVTGKITLTRVSAAPPGAHAISGSWRTATVENVSEPGLTVTFKSTADELSMNRPTGEYYEAKFDGKNYPVNGNRAGGTVSLQKVNSKTIVETYKQDGKPVQVNEMSVEGNTLKVVSKNLRQGTTTSITAEKQ